MLIILVVIKITRVLLDTRVDTEGTGVGLLDTEIICLQLAINLTLLLTVGASHPDALDIGATDDVVPVGVGPTGVLLGQGEHRVVVHGIREEVRDLIPKLTSLIREGLQLILEDLKGLGGSGSGGSNRSGLLNVLLRDAQDLLELLLERGNGRGGRSDQQSSWQNSHLDV
jgi:hypothetical protein